MTEVELPSIWLPREVAASGRKKLFGYIPSEYRIEVDHPNYKVPIEFRISGVFDSSPIHMNVISTHRIYKNLSKILSPYSGSDKISNLHLEIGLNKGEMEKEIPDFTQDSLRPTRVIGRKYLSQLRRLRLLVEFPEYAVTSIPDQQTEGLIFQYFRPIVSKPGDFGQEVFLPDDPEYLSRITAILYQIPVK